MSIIRSLSRNVCLSCLLSRTASSKKRTGTDCKRVATGLERYGQSRGMFWARPEDVSNPLLLQFDVLIVSISL